MLIISIKRSWIVLITGILFVALFSGCASNKKGSSQSEQSSKDRSTPQVKSKTQKEYEEALDVLRDGKIKQAERLFKGMVQRYPDFSGPHTNLGLIYFNAGDDKKAEQSFRDAIEVNFNSAVSYNHLGIIHRKRGEFKKARSFYEKSLEINPAYYNAHLNLGILLDLYIGELPLALQHYEQYQKLVGTEDKMVKKWLIDLKRRIKRSRK